MLIVRLWNARYLAMSQYFTLCPVSAYDNLTNESSKRGFKEDNRQTYEHSPSVDTDCWQPLSKQLYVYKYLAEALGSFLSFLHIIKLTLTKTNKKPSLQPHDTSCERLFTLIFSVLVPKSSDQVTETSKSLSWCPSNQPTNSHKHAACSSCNMKSAAKQKEHTWKTSWDSLKSP